MNKSSFISTYKEAFGDYELPIGIWYSEEPAGELNKTKGCFIKDLKPARQGQVISFNPESVACPGGKLYCGFTKMPPFVPKFVSEKERYKASQELVTNFVEELCIPNKADAYLNFASISTLDNFDNLEGLIFFATPDVLSGLVSWAQFDTNDAASVSIPFGSGCSSIIAQTIVENQNNGQRTFLGMFDPSVRPQVESNILSFAIPMSRFVTMYNTMNQSCLSGAHAWLKVKERINTNEI